MVPCSLSSNGFWFHSFDSGIRVTLHSYHSSLISLTLFRFCSGGMELLFQNQKSIKITVPVPEGGGLRIRQLLRFIRDEIKPERPELFMQEDTM